MMDIPELTQKMISISKGDLHDIEHFLKVWAYARTLGKLEGLGEQEQLLLEAAALVHDIACPLCREKYGNTNGKYQEQEGEPMAFELLTGLDWPRDLAMRVARMVGKHHSPGALEGWDFQLLLESDYLVNASESCYSKEKIRYACDRLFVSASGKALLKSIYLGEDS